ncbi:MAG: tetratricopeptide repeat protein [Acidobacteriota bacterium]|nr:tetratricopeptide repeat protein [Acidobacteriota bacterium]
MEKISHYCQKCRAANEPGELSCHKCGTRLMIVTLPPSLRHEEEIIPTYYEDHLLERVSLLEFRLAQITEQLAMAYEFISRQGESFEKSHLIISSFMDSLKEINPEIAGNLADKFNRNYDNKKSLAEGENRQQKLLKKIYASHNNPNIELFSHLVEEGIKLLKCNEEKQGFRTLERAALLSPQNIPLFLYIAEKLFDIDKFDSAKDYLNKVYELSPQESKALLLLGVIYADEAQAEKARKFLSVLAGIPDMMICANYVWGILAAFEGNWNESLAAFKECLEFCEEAEIYYLIGSGYFQVFEYEKSLQFYEKALEFDSKFADAWFMQGVIYSILNKQKQAAQAKHQAFEVKEAGAKCLQFHKNDFMNMKTALPFLHFKNDKKRVLTNASVRLNKFLRRKVSESLKT